jgi:hypothetical protein
MGWMKASSHNYAANSLASIGPAAKDALPALIKLAEKTAPDEWARVKDKNPKLGTEYSAYKYSENEIIEAICQIRRE